MARFLIATISAAGHVNPALPIARFLVERSHEVWWYTGKGFKDKVEATGAHHVPIRTGLDFTDMSTIPQSWLDQKEANKGVAQFKFYLKHGFIDAGVTQLLDLTEILRSFPADVLLCDVFFIGVSWLSEKTGLPWAAFGMSALPLGSRDTAPFGLGIQPTNSAFGRLRNAFLNGLSQRVLMRDVTVHLDRVRVSVGLPPKSQDFFSAALSPFLYLQGTTPTFEYPRSDLPGQVHFIGPFLPSLEANFTRPAWWEELSDGKPVVFVTQGTVATDAGDLILPAIEALANDNVLVIVTTGGQPIDNLGLDSMPANVRVEKFIPYEHLLPNVDVMVTNAGFNGVQLALANGVPLVTAGQTEEKPEICARVQWAGVGIDLKTSTPRPMQIRDAVMKILGSSQYRQRAFRFKTEIAQYDAPALATALLEQLASTKKPVLRAID
ncbi:MULTISPECIES: glycosyltransferase [Cyanophyceae]|uniref:glycosyltransferase n=1 Tax=Cyanophyceae TaxID=3028117 RepID=UPI00168A3095|nr:nucleotide disphospho-sugar-binding domain-containing protein [Trichocoleus sp. FACHB-40]MBD2005204.1 glycosyltransferase [Trichocoleus sp. FACHB-40]